MMREPLVLIPPMLCDARVFEPVTTAFSAHHAVAVMPTTGADRIEEIASRILDWAPPKFALLGVAMGGAVALEIMRRAPTRILRIAVMSATAQAETPQAAAAREPLIVAARAGRFTDVVSQELPPSSLAAGQGRANVHALVTQMAQTLGAGAYVGQARAMQRRRDQAATLRQIKQPAVVIGGEVDTIVPARRLEFMAEMIPYARLEIIKGAGHLPLLEKPDATLTVLKSWLAQPLVLR